MKSPVPFIKPKSYYESHIKPRVIHDEVINQSNPVEKTITEKETIVVENIQYEKVELIKPKKLNKKSTELES